MYSVQYLQSNTKIQALVKTKINRNLFGQMLKILYHISNLFYHMVESRYNSLFIIGSLIISGRAIFNFFIVLLQSCGIFTSFGKFTLLHTFTHIPIDDIKNTHSFNQELCYYHQLNLLMQVHILLITSKKYWKTKCQSQNDMISDIW